MLSEHEYFYWLSYMKTEGEDFTTLLMSNFESICDIYNAKEEELARLTNEKTAARMVSLRDEACIKKEYESLEKKGIRMVLRSDVDFPARLTFIPDSPWYLFVKGSLPDPALPAVSMVGSRACSQYGRQNAEAFACELAANGVVIVSGLAEGIDGAAHRGALLAGGFTVGVLGSGIDIVYPRVNWQLFSQLESGGCIISEYQPGTRALPFHFPIRNRIISGMSDAVLVLEARKKSGTLHTVDHALEQGKDVFAVPGRINDPLSEGCNALIQQGARLVTRPADILAELCYRTDYEEIKSSKNNEKKMLLQKKKGYEFNAKEWIIYNACSFEAKDIDTLAQQTGLGIPDIADALYKLREKGCIVFNECEGYYINEHI